MTSTLVATQTISHPVKLTSEMRKTIYTNLRQSAAMASGLEAMAVRALELGHTTEQDLDSIADLSTLLRNELSRISIVINELSGD